MMDSATYLVTQEIAERSGLIDTRYRIADGRFVLNDRDLARVRFTTDEYISGLKGVERVTTQVAETLIAQNNYTMGMNEPAQPIVESVSQPTMESETVEDSEQQQELPTDKDNKDNEQETNDEEE